MLCGTANASLIGQQLTFECTNCAPPFSEPFIVTEGLGPELSFFDAVTIDVEASSLRLDWIFNTNSLIEDLNFVWHDLVWSGPGKIVGATVDQSSTWGADIVPVFSENSLSITNNGDSSVSVGDFMLIHFEVRHDIPVPLPLALLGLGLAGLGLARRCRKG
ncbi:MAG: hypothetical protein D6763_11260 [Alphaproteobacteria bacterium]|nr:MAG: hypothetical protein D6763_11260 [Alphaproteobacteria bacterium]